MASLAQHLTGYGAQHGHKCLRHAGTNALVCTALCGRVQIAAGSCKLPQVPASRHS